MTNRQKAAVAAKLSKTAELCVELGSLALARALLDLVDTVVAEPEPVRAPKARAEKRPQPSTSIEVALGLAEALKAKLAANAAD